MRAHTIESLHHNVHRFNGKMYFLLDGRLLSVTVGTPSFNDYGEWRINYMELSSLPYDPAGDEGTKIKNEFFTPISVTDKELAYFDAFLSYSDLTDEEFYSRTNQFLSDNPGTVCPYDYLSEPFLASGFMKGDTELTHFITKNDGKDEKTGEPSVDIDGEFKAADWEKRADITVDQGMFNILIPMMEAFVFKHLSLVEARKESPKNDEILI